MQVISYKIFLSIVLFIVNLNVINALDKKEKFLEGDSLEHNGKTAAALKIYQSILNINKQYNQELLLRMAAITEKQGNYPACIYYLNTCYQLKPNSALKEKILNLADKHQLDGYYFTDFDLISHYFYSLQEPIAVVLSLFVLVILLRMVYNRIKRKTIIYYPLVSIIGLTLLFGVINIQSFNQKGIIAYPQSRLMEGASAASECKFTTNQGHRVTILNKTDTWYKINWKGEEVYINQKNMLLLPL